jgi:hypothetical protein
MQQQVTFSDFLDAFRRAGREDQFSYEAKKALFEYLENLEKETGKQVELDVIALCCEYQEADIVEIIDDYDLETFDCEDDDWYTLVTDFLEDRTTVIWSNGERFLFQQF